MGVKKERIVVTVMTCERCGHRWLPRKPLEPIDPNEFPTVCTSCKSRYWNTPVTSPAKRTNVKRAK